MLTILGVIGAFGLAIVGTIKGFQYVLKHSAKTNKKPSPFSSKKYEGADIKGFGNSIFYVGLFLSLGLVLTAFEWKSDNEYTICCVGYTSGEEDFEQTKITIIEPPPPPPKPVVQVKPIIKEVEDTKELENDDKYNFENGNTDDTIPIVEIESGDDGDLKEEKTDDIVVIAETPAEPYGGMEKFYKFIKKKLKYPKAARRMGVEGKVFVQFVIEKDGSFSNIKILKGVGAGCNEEAVRVLKLAKKWKPAKQRGVPVRQRMVVPFFFQLSR